MKIFGIVLVGSLCGLTQGASPGSDETRPQDILDTMAWAANWVFEIGMYAGRQERPWRRRDEGELDDLPKIYIPNELTGNEIVRALKKTGKEQAVIEENEFLDFLDFHVKNFNESRLNDSFSDDEDYSSESGSGDIFGVKDSDDFDFYSNGSYYGNYSDYRDPRIDDWSDIYQYLARDSQGNFVLSKQVMNYLPSLEFEKIFRTPYPSWNREIKISIVLLRKFIGESIDIKALLSQILPEIKQMRSYSSWDEMVSDDNDIYQTIMSILENQEKPLIKKTKDGFYTLSKTSTDLIYKAINATVLEERRQRSNVENDFQAFREYKKFEEKVESMIQASATILHLPNQLSWDSIKATLQAMWKKTIPQIHQYQFLTKTLDYLEIDTDEKGMSKLSPFLTQALVDMMWGLFGYIHPITN